MAAQNTVIATVSKQYTHRQPQPKRANELVFISLANIDQFQKFFHWHTVRTICNNVIIKYPTTP